MRKQMKNKKRARGMCKPHKRGWTNRWRPKEESRIKETDRQIREADGRQ